MLIFLHDTATGASATLLEAAALLVSPQTPQMSLSFMTQHAFTNVSSGIGLGVYRGQSNTLMYSCRFCFTPAGIRIASYIHQTKKQNQQKTLLGLESENRDLKALALHAAGRV